VATGAAWLKGRNSRRGREKQKHPYKKERKKERKTYLTLTSLLMEGPMLEKGHYQMAEWLQVLLNLNEKCPSLLSGT